jgi:hypothetical protein
MKLEDKRCKQAFSAKPSGIPLRELSGFRVDAFIYKDLQSASTGFGRASREVLGRISETLDCLGCVQVDGCARPNGFAADGTNLPSPC